MKDEADITVPVLGMLFLCTVICFAGLGLVVVFFGVTHMSGFGIALGLVAIFLGLVAFFSFVAGLIDFIPDEQAETAGAEATETPQPAEKPARSLLPRRRGDD